MIALWPQYGPASPCHQALPTVNTRIPCRIPNWKIRANGLIDGRPTISVCRMPSARVGLHEPGHTQDGRAAHDAVGVEHDHAFVIAAAPGAEVAYVAGLEAGVVGAPAVLQPGWTTVGALPGGEQRPLAGRHEFVLRVAEQEDVEGIGTAGRIETGKRRPQ